MTPKSIDRHTKRTFELIVKHWKPTPTEAARIKYVLGVRADQLKGELIRKTPKGA